MRVLTPIQQNSRPTVAGRSDFSAGPGARCGFISVGAVRQCLLATARACFSLPGVTGLIAWAWRLDSSLRSHRAAAGFGVAAGVPGLNKTLFASSGPDSHERGHRRVPRAASGVRALSWGGDDDRPGRINAGRGHRSDATCDGQVRHVAWVPSIRQAILRMR